MAKEKANDDIKFIPEICKIKHEMIDKEINGIKEDIKELKEDEEKAQAEKKEMIRKLPEDIKENYENLKNKVILAEKLTGTKIDQLDEFDSKLKGNGTPGIWESVRTMKRNVNIIFFIVVFILIISLGGNWEGVTFKSAREKIWGKKDD